MRATLLILALLALLAFPVFADDCYIPAYDYCLNGCPDLGNWIGEKYGSIEAAESARNALVGIEKLSAFVVQPPRHCVLLLRRPLVASGDESSEGVTVEQYESVVGAAAFARVNGGWVYTTNDPAVTLRVTVQECAAKSRPIRR